MRSNGSLDGTPPTISMHHFITRITCFLVGITACHADDRIDFDRRIAPLLAARCLECHNAQEQKGKLDLTNSKVLLRKDHPILVPGKSAESLLWEKVDGNEMPPKKPLSAAEKATLKEWIDAGAPWGKINPIVRYAYTTDTHAGTNWWSLRTVQRPALPQVTTANWVQNPIDRFILAKLEARGLVPAAPASRRQLIRRVYFDLIGLPPTPQEIDAFEQDGDPRAYEKLIDQLLASPHYGERWARHWLDVARYTESQGFEYDRIRPNAWHYRDYVIAAFNKDKPYNVFIAEQLAGDVVNIASPTEPVTPEGMVATSLLVCGPWDQAGNSQANVTQRMTTREEELEDLVSVVGQTFLGLTVNCARCHDHKYDPITQVDYYRFKANFEGVHHGDRPVALQSAVKLRQDKLDRLKFTLASVELALKIEQRERIVHFDWVGLGRTLEPTSYLQTQLASLRQQIKDLPVLPEAYIGHRRQPAPTHLLKRGSVSTPGEVVAPGPLTAIKLPTVIPALPADAPEAQRRLALARWITSPQHPLTARVMVNRLWHYHFGRGIVETPNDFGFNGSPPTHPELLDWLAAEFMEGQPAWSIKRMHRLILLSATYKQGSIFNTNADKIDSENTLLWRYTPRRLEGEIVRDAMLSVSGQLNTKRGGPSYRPFTVSNFNSDFYENKDMIGPDYNRRTIYRIHVNSGKSALMDALDCPDPSIKTPARRVTTTPLAALALMNNSFVQRQAQHLAERVTREAPGRVNDAIALAYQLTLGRQPTPQEVEQANKLVKEQSLTSLCWVLLNSTEFLYVK